jgi:hypothetical protein
MKAGIKTTEFWLAIATALIGNLVMFGVIPTDFPQDELIGGATSIIAVVAYIISRIKVKTTPPNGG